MIRDYPNYLDFLFHFLTLTKHLGHPSIGLQFPQSTSDNHLPDWLLVLTKPEMGGVRGRFISLSKLVVPPLY